MKTLLNKIWQDAVVIIAFLLISLAYFFTPVTQGLVLSGHDNTGGIGANQELTQYNEQTGETTRWTNSLFSGMPTYQMAPEYGSRTVLSTMARIYELGTSGVVMYLFVSLLGFYILMRAFDFKVWMSALGAIVWAFSSYFFIIIAAGHLWKVMTLAFIPPTIAGMVLCYRGKLLWGGIVTAIFVALQILSNHLQMTYYFLFVMLFMAIGYFVQALLDKKLPDFCKATGVLIVAAIIGVSANISNLYHTYEYSKETMRGKSELAQTASNGNAQKGGLSADYITQWSYGIGETWSLLVPNVKGGASVPLAANEDAMKKADSNFVQIYQQIGQYWGEQPGTSGPVYVGAFVCFLFILGIFIVKGGLKWGLLVATLVSFLFAWGNNIMPFTQWLIDNLPMYNKFRAVSSALVMAEFTIPLLAMLALGEIVKDPDLLKRKRIALDISIVLTLGVCLIFAVFPTLVFSDYISSSERAQIPAEYLNAISNNLSEVRQSIFTSDAWRSFWIIIIGLAFVLLYSYKKLKTLPMLIGITILCLGDMWMVNKRYLNNDSFVESWENEKIFTKTQTDEVILQDKSLDYRVLNLSTNTFNENTTSYWHKSIGGYHAAKLRRYQDLIQHCITPEMSNISSAVAKAGGDMTKVNGDSIMPVLNMLNAKYFIFSIGNGETVPILNPYANGNAWFAQSISFVEGADKEIKALKSLDTKKAAVADVSFKEALNQKVFADSTAKVVLTAYQPNELTYEAESQKGGVIVFSEVYYPGWTATVDGNPVEIGRANYTLRAISVPAGKHKIVMTFSPSSINTTEAVAYVSLLLLLGAIIFAIVRQVKAKK